MKPSPLTLYNSDSWKQTKKNEAFTHNSLSFSRLQGKGEEVKVVFETADAHAREERRQESGESAQVLANWPRVRAFNIEVQQIRFIPYLE